MTAPPSHRHREILPQRTLDTGKSGKALPGSDVTLS